MATTQDTVKKTEVIPELTEFPLLDLLPELQLKVYEFLVTFDDPIYPRELMPLNRTHDELNMNNIVMGRAYPSSGQPNITKVSRQVRKDALALYYSRNLFRMDNNVTETSCMVPFSRYPSFEDAHHLRHLRRIECLVKLADHCPNPASQKPSRSYTFELEVCTTKNKNGLVIKLEKHHAMYSNEARLKFLKDTIMKGVGQPKDKVYDGHHLLKTAIFCSDGLVCRDYKPAWRGLDAPPPNQQPLFGPGAAAGVTSGVVPLPPLLSGMSLMQSIFPNMAAQLGVPPAHANAAIPGQAQVPAIPPPLPAHLHSALQPPSVMPPMPPAPTLQPVTANHPNIFYGGALTMSFNPNPALLHSNPALYNALAGTGPPVPASASSQGQAPPPVTAGGGFSGWAYPHNPTPAPTTTTTAATAPNAAPTLPTLIPAGAAPSSQLLFGHDSDLDVDDEDEPAPNPWPTQ